MSAIHIGAVSPKQNMKTLLTYVLVASMGLVTSYTFAKGQEGRIDYVTSLKTLPLEDDDFTSVSDSVEPSIETIPHYWFRKKQSLIYYLNTFEAIDAAICRKDYLQNWASDFQTLSSPGLIKLSSLPGRDTHFHNALMINVKERKVTTTGEYQLSPNAKASIKLPFLKQEIGEYHHQRMFGTFAVFR